MTGRDGRSCCKGTRAPVYWPAPGAGSLVPETSQGSDTGHPPSCQSETEPPEDSLEDECRVFVLLDAVNGRAPSRTTENVQHGAKILAPIRCPSKPHTTEKETEQGRNKSKSLIQDQCVNIVEQSSLVGSLISSPLGVTFCHYSEKNKKNLSSSTNF